MNTTALVSRRQLLVPAIIAAVVIGGVAVTFAIDAVAVQTTHHAVIWPYVHFAHDLRTTTWSSSAVVAVAAAVGIVGLLLLVIAARPAPGTHLVLKTSQARETIYISPRSVRRAVEHAAVDVEGVERAEVTWRRDRVDLTVTWEFRDSTGAEQAVRAAAVTCLEHMGLADPPEVDVAVKHPSKVR
jgi:hypothetical protein